MADRRIRIETIVGDKGAHFVQVVDADSGEPMSDVTAVVIMVPSADIVMASVLHGDSASSQKWYAVEKIDVTISSDVVGNNEEKS
jgi:hypothetical protein